MSQIDFIKYTRTPEFQAILKEYEEALNSGVNSFIEAEDIIDIAEYFHINKMLEKADEAADYCLEVHPGNISALFFKSRMALTDFNDADRAEQILQEITDYDKYTEGVYIYAEILMSKGDAHAAHTMLKEKYDKIKTAADNQAEEEQQYDHDEEGDDEDEDYKMAFTHFPLDAAVIFCDYGFHKYARFWMEKFNAPPEDLVFEYWETWGRIYLDEDDFEKAIKAWNCVLDIDAYNVNAWLQLWDAQLRSGKAEEALQSAEYALAIEPDTADGLTAKGCSLFELKRYDEAIETFNLLEKLFPEDTQPNLYLATIYLEMKDIEKGMKQFRNAINKSDYDPNITVKIGSILYEMNYKEAAYLTLTTIVRSYEETNQMNDCPDQLLDYLIMCCKDLQKTEELEKYTKIRNSRLSL